MNKKKALVKFIAIFMAIFFIAFISYANIMVQTYKHCHECTGEHCPICATIQAAESLLNNLGYVKASIGIFVSLCFLYSIISVTKDNFQSTTLVALKVRMDN